MRGEFDSFCRFMKFAGFLCTSWKRVCLLKGFMYIRRHFLDTLNWFQAHSWVMSISSATVHKHAAHRRTILEGRCSTTHHHTRTLQPFCPKSMVDLKSMAHMHFYTLTLCALLKTLRFLPFQIRFFGGGGFFVHRKSTRQ